MRKPMIGLSAAAVLFASTPVHAQDEAHLQERQRILGLIEEVKSDPDRRTEAIRRGHDRISFCSHCHGDDGNSKRPEIPNLAGQNPAYLLEQFDLFADGRRKNFVMQTLAKEFTLEDKINISIYYSAQKIKPAETSEPRYARRGQALYNNVCKFCHGEDGRGEAGYARLAGQQMTYVANTLMRYRTNATSEPDPTEIKRTDARMEQVTQSLSNEDIKALASYIASMK